MTEQNEPTLNEVQAPKKSNETLYLVLLPVIFLFGLAVGYLLWNSGVDIANDTAALDALEALVTRQETLVGELEELVNTGGVVADAGSSTQGGGSAPAQPGAAPEEITVPDDLPRYDIPILDSDPQTGSVDAPIVIVEYSDFQCPYCQRHNAEVKPLLMEKYGDNILYVYKDFPLTSIHPQAFPASEAALCANEQEAYEPFHELLFSGTMELGPAAYLAFAEQLGLDIDAFTACVEEGRYTEEVQADLDYAVNLGVRSTPTFFINGIAVVGAQPYDVFAGIIESELGN